MRFIPQTVFPVLKITYFWIHVVFVISALFYFNVFILLISVRFFDVSKLKDIKRLLNWSVENQLMSKCLELNYHLHVHLHHLKSKPSVKGMWGPCLRIIAKMSLLN